MGKKVESLGERIKRARDEAGLSLQALRTKIQEDHRAEIGESTIRNIEQGVPPNPGIKTVELICLGLGLPPLEVIALALDDPPDLDDGFTRSRFATLWKEYSRLTADKRNALGIDALIEMLIAQMRKV